MNLSQPNRPLRLRLAGDCGDQQTLLQGVEIESSVEAISESGEVSSRIFWEAERMITARQASFEVAEHRVDPLEFRQVFRFAPGHNGGLVHATGLSDGTEAGQPIREDRASRCEMRFCPVRNRLEGKPGHGHELDVQRVPVIAERDGSHERNLVLRAAPGLAAAAFAAEVRIIDLNLSFEHIALFALGHRQHQFVVNEPCGRVAHAEMPLQRQRRQASLGLADQVDRHEPYRQRQLCALKHRAGDEGALMPAGIALKDFVGASTQDAMRVMAAARTAKAVWPARFLKRLLALRFAPIAFEKLGHRQPRLKLNSIHCHDGALLNGMMYRIHAARLTT